MDPINPKAKTTTPAAPPQAPEDVKGSGIVGSPGLTRIVATSFAPPPGHWRGGHFWPAGVMVSADVSPKQEGAIRADGRLSIFDPNAKIPTSSEVLAEYQRRVKLEAERIALERDRATAAEKMRKSSDRGGMRYER